MNSLGPEELQELDGLLASVNLRLLPYPGEPQEEFVNTRGGELFYGGTRGGAKTHGLVIAFNRFRLACKKAKAQAFGAIFRRTMPELEEIVELSKDMLPYTGGKWNGSRSTWRWPDGSYLRLRFIDKDQDASKYQGHNLNWIGIDEAGNFPTQDPINRLRGSLRTTRAIKPELRLTGNPGGPGHTWLKNRYVLGQYEKRQDWFVKYIFSTIANNPGLMRNDPGYIDRLRDSGPDWLVRAWLEGDWDIVPGGYFDGAWDSSRQVLQRFEIPSHWPVYLGFDWGHSKPSAMYAIAISDGIFTKTLSGEITYLPPGSPVIFRELYTCEHDRNGQPKANLGTRLDNEELGQACMTFQSEVSSSTPNIQTIVADSSIWTDDGGESIYAQMSRGAEAVGHGLGWRKCTKNARSARANGMLKLMRASRDRRMDTIGIFVTQDCPNWIRTVPTLPMDTRTMDAVDPNAEDHSFDATCYALTEYYRDAGISVFRPSGI